MSIVDFLLLRSFLPNVFARTNLAERMEKNRVSSLVVHVFGTKNSVHFLQRKGKMWTEVEKGANSPQHSVLILTTKSVSCVAEELPSLPNGNTEEAVAAALEERPQFVLRNSYKSDRRYHIISLPQSRFAVVASVRESEIHIAETEAAKKGVPAVRAIIGTPAAFKVASQDIAERFPQATALVISDQDGFSVFPVRNRQIDISRMMFMRHEVGDEHSLADIQREISTLAADEEAQPFVALYRTPSSISVDVNIMPESVSSQVYNISIAELCFA